MRAAASAEGLPLLLGGLGRWCSLRRRGRRGGRRRRLLCGDKEGAQTRSCCGDAAGDEGDGLVIEAGGCSGPARAPSWRRERHRREGQEERCGRSQQHCDQKAEGLRIKFRFFSPLSFSFWMRGSWVRGRNADIRQHAWRLRGATHQAASSSWAG